MDYELSRHAVDVIGERRIPMEWVESVIKNPKLAEVDKNDPSLEHRLASIPDYGGRVLRVIINAQARPLLVITAYFDRSMKGKL